MALKTHTTAVVLIPPAEIWPPLQAIRQVHDRHLRRWMPHITLLYPFRPHDEFADLAKRFAAVCAGVEPFRLELAELRFFRHRRESFTLWLAPEPKMELIQLQTLLGGIVPDCAAVLQHRDGFTPHLSVGQVRGERLMLTVKAGLEATWQPIAFTVRGVSLIWRGEPPDDVFRLGLTVELGVQR
jgi:RNA 2',3'-cyclic 3'-phosphodiesterase